MARVHSRFGERQRRRNHRNASLLILFGAVCVLLIAVVVGLGVTVEPKAPKLRSQWQ